MNVVDGYVITTCYDFTFLSDCEKLKEKLLADCQKLSLKGTILIGAEGMNFTLAGVRENINSIYELLRTKYDINLDDIKESFCNFLPFDKMKVKVKKEIVTIGIEGIDVTNDCGEYISPKDWDSFIARDDVITIDTRNVYEYELGTFEKAVNPNTNAFRNFPDWVEENAEMLKNKKIAMFCTGGVRCEKSTAFMKKAGYKDVYHLQGGILNYFDKKRGQSQSWHGNCFVFDNRVALTKDLEPSGDLICKKCSSPLTTDDVRENQKGSICSNCVAK